MNSLMWPRNTSMTVSFVFHAESVRMRRITHQQEPFSHLLENGFMPNYNVWTEHGERGIMLENDEEEDDFVPQFEDDYYGALFEDTTMGEPEEDVEA
jgi:hypothetical protein